MRALFVSYYLNAARQMNDVVYWTGYGNSGVELRAWNNFGDRKAAGVDAAAFAQSSFITATRTYGTTCRTQTSNKVKSNCKSTASHTITSPLTTPSSTSKNFPAQRSKHSPWTQSHHESVHADKAASRRAHLAPSSVL